MDSESKNLTTTIEARMNSSEYPWMKLEKIGRGSFGYVYKGYTNNDDDDDDDDDNVHILILFMLDCISQVIS